MPNPNFPATSDRTAAPVLPVVLSEPKAGGNYLRDPVTGALTLDIPSTIQE